MLSKNENLSLHDGSSAWGILNYFALNRSHLEVYFLQCTDPDLKKFIRNFLKFIEKDITGLRQVLANNNIDYPISYPSRNLDQQYNLNEATKYEDTEIAYMLLEIKRSALPIFSNIIANSYSLDMIDEVTNYYNEFLSGLKDILRMIDKKGWMRSVPMIPSIDTNLH